jgi:hypothetical protein
MMGIEVSEVSVAEISTQLERSFHQLAQDEKIGFSVDVSENFGPSLFTVTNACNRSCSICRQRFPVHRAG